MKGRLGFLLVLIFLLPAGTSVPQASARARSDDPRIAVLGPTAVEVRPAHFEITLPDGQKLLSHGGDPLVPMLDHGSNIGPGDPERAPVCATGYRQMVLYAHQAGTQSDYAASVPAIRAQMRRTNAVLNEEALSSGGINADFRMACDANGEILVGAVESPGPDFDLIVTAAKQAGYNDPQVDYTIFYDGEFPGLCGVGNFSGDERPGADNANNAGLDYAVTYGSCWFSRTPMHENGHNQGAVQDNSPHSTAGGHCWQTIDVMCYSPDGGTKHQQGTVSDCSDRMHYDCQNDDYFDAGPEPGEYLASNWNIGSAANRFIVLGSNAPVASFTSSCDGLTCTFTDTSTAAGSRTISSRSWNLGDGTTATTANVTHTYASPATYDVTLQVTDSEGGIASTARQIVFPVAPVFFSPAQGATTRTRLVSIAGSGPSNAQIQIREGGATIATVIASSSGGWATQYAFPPGPHTLDAVAITPLGTGPPSALRSFTADPDLSAPAPPTITTPAGGSVHGPSISASGTAEPRATVRVFSGATIVGAGTAGSSGNFTVALSLLGNGLHTLTARAYDAAGNVSDPSVSVLIDVDAIVPEVSLWSAPLTRASPAPLMGITRDDRSVVRVTVEIKDALSRSAGTIEAVIEPRGEDGWSQWSAEPPSLLPGRYTATAYAYDGVANRSKASTLSFLYV